MKNFRTEKYSRLAILPTIGPKGLNAISNSKVGIFGLGGLGSWSSLMLAQMGVGLLRLVDRDVVEISNLPRTPIYNLDSVDLPKAERAAKFLKNLNPDIKIEETTANISESSVESLVKDLDIVIDGLDNVSTRLVVNKACKKFNIPYIFAGAIGTSANISTFLYKEEEPCLNCIFEMISDDDLEKCDVAGVHTALLSLVASIQVTEAIKIIVGEKPVFVSKLCYIYLNSLEIDHIPIKRNQSCPVCGAKTVSKIQKTTKIVELCGDKTFLVPNKAELQVNLDKIVTKLETGGYTILKKGSLGITFEFKSDSSSILISIFSNGNFLVRGESNQSVVKQIYTELIQNLFT